MKKGTLTERQVIDIFEIIKQKASDKMQSGHLEQSICYIEVAAQWAYNYNFKYVDEDLEFLLQNISCSIKERLLQDRFTVNNGEERIVLVCNRTINGGEVTQQYSKALAKVGVPVLIIVLNRIVQINGVRIGSIEIPAYLQDKENITIKIIEESRSLMDTTEEVAREIRNFTPTKIFTHVWPWDARLIIAVMAAKQCPCYNINFNDHTFWIGKSMLDYLIEFRPYGASVSVDRRGVKLSQLLYLPYYPIISDDIPFQGFPFDRTGKVVIFTGGTEYKMLDEENLFFDIMDKVLDDNPNSIVFLASTSLREIKKRILRMKNGERVYTSKYRKDISQLFRNCDIYYGTYPLSGGLMCQYAAAFGKPILAYAKKRVELDEVDGIVNYHNEAPIAKNDLDTLFAYAKELCNDPLYRKSEGQRLRCAVINSQEFDKKLNDLLTGNYESKQMLPLDIAYDNIKEFYFNYANNYCNGYLSLLLKTFKFRSFIYFPRYSVLFVMRLLDFFIYKLKAFF